MYFKWILFWFELVSGLKINMAKSELILLGEISNIEDLASLLGFVVGKLPYTHL